VSRLQWNSAKTGCSETEVTDEGLNSLVLGPSIAKGCNAVVYAARKKQGIITYDSTNCCVNKCC
jgi:hypothetical protein